jgi:HlyD family secretion protein
MNGQQTNGNRPANDDLNNNGATVKTATKENQMFSSLADSQQGVVFRQSPSWSRGVIWTIMGVTSACLLWAAVAKIEQVIPAQGQLKPQGTVKEVQAPLNGVVKEVLVKDGEKVEKDQVLVILDSSASKVELDSLQKIRAATLQENEFYRRLLDENLDTQQLEALLIRLKIPQQIASLARNRTSLMAENKLFAVQIGDSTNVLNPDQISRFNVAKRELDARQAAARLEMSKFEKELAQTQVRLTDTRNQLLVDRQVLAEIKARNEKAMVQSEQSLGIEKNILKDIAPLEEEGAVARYQINKQKQAVNDRVQQIIEQRANGQIEYDKQDQTVQNRLAEIDRLEQEAKRLRYAIDQAQEQLNTTTATAEKDVRDRIAENQKRIAEIDSQLTKILVDNERRINELNSQTSRAEQTLRYQEIKSPVTGTVFDLKAAPGYVPPPSQTEPMLKIVPQDYLIAEVNITNKDIGFVTEGQKADIRIDSFPYSEYGDIKGKVLSIGSDALPPDQFNQYYRFPTKIELNQQYLLLKEGQKMPLQSGMGVTVNIKVNENRTVLSLFTELFTKKVDSIKGVR